MSGENNKPSNNDDKINEIIEYSDINKKHKNTKFLIIGIIIYIIALIFYLLYLKLVYGNAYVNKNLYGVYYLERDISANIIFIFLIIGANSIISNYYFDKLKDKKKMRMMTYIVILVIYTIMILNITLITRPIGMHGYRYNLIPFKTMLNYIINFNHFDIKLPILNIFGNLFLLMPIQYLIIKIFNLKKFKFIFFIDLIIILVNELLPFILQTKIFDIDHIILNLLGMVIVYFIIKFKNRKKEN